MKPTHKIAYDYCMAMIQQRHGEDQVSKAFVALGSDNQIFALAEPLESAYTKLVHELIGEELFDWLQWWMYECEYGTRQMHFVVNNTTYDPTTITLFKFLELIDAS